MALKFKEQQKFDELPKPEEFYDVKGFFERSFKTRKAMDYLTLIPKKMDDSKLPLSLSTPLVDLSSLIGSGGPILELPIEVASEANSWDKIFSQATKNYIQNKETLTPDNTSAFFAYISKQDLLTYFSRVFHGTLPIDEQAYYGLSAPNQKQFYEVA